MRDAKAPASNLKLTLSAFICTLLFAVIYNHNGWEHFLSSFSKSLIIITILYLSIQISQEQKDALSHEEYNRKRKRISLFASLFTGIQITTLKITEALIFSTEIPWIKYIGLGLAMTIIFLIVSSVCFKYFFVKRHKKTT